MAKAQGLCCITSALRGKPSGDARRSSAACICCIGPRHNPSGGGSCVPCLAPNADHSVRAPLTGCCGGGDVRGRAGAGACTPRTPKTPCTPTARRICGVRSRTPRSGQVCCFPAAASAGATVAAVAVARTPRTPTTPIGRCCVRRPMQAAGAGAAPARRPRTPTTPIGRCCVRGGGAMQGNAKLGRRSRWFRSARQALAQTPRLTARAGGGRRDIARGNGGGAVKVYNARLAEAEEALNAEVEASSNNEYAMLCREGFSREDVAAVTIQAYFRGHLARRAFRALRSLVRLQAVARGAYVRRQAETAVHCMQAMVRLQVRVRARQMLANPNEGQLMHT